jgi:hypothetical protein
MNPSERAIEKMAAAPAKVARAYREVFEHPSAPTVLAHLMDTCCVNETTIDENPLIMAAAEGRRQVWVAMNNILSMDARDIRDVNRAVASWGENE